MYLVDCFGIIYKIDTDHGNAEIISFDIDPDLVEIGYTINYNSKSYPITRIRNESKVKSEIESISFVDDSSVIALRKHAFNQSPIRSLTFPANFQYFEKGWCEEANYLVDIKISPYNKKYKCVDKMILGKSNPSSDIYDVLIFACRDITDVIIPPSVKWIDYSCFDGCTKIKNFIIPENSELQSIFKCAFANSSIKKLVIPSKFKKFEKGWCEDATELNEITVSKENPNFIVDENHLVLGKSNADSEVFDIVYFAPRNIKNARISSDVKYLNSYAFDICIQIESIEFDENSKLISIGSFCFFESSLRVQNTRFF